MSDKKGLFNLGGLFLVGAVVIIGGFSVTKAFTTSQQVGQVGVWTSPTKKFVKITTEEGINEWNPLNSVTFYDIKNNTVKFSVDDNSGGDKDALYSPSITIQNKEGVSGEVELSVMYSISPDFVKDIWERYGSQQSFNSNYVVQIIRSNVRDVFTPYTSLESYNVRSQIEKDIEKNLKEEFSDKGIIIDNVALQNINYPTDIQESFNVYAKNVVELDNEKTKAEKALINAQSQVDVAKKSSEANEILSKSITDEILADRYIEMLEKTGNKVIITDGKTIPYVNFDGSKAE